VIFPQKWAEGIRPIFLCSDLTDPEIVLGDGISTFSTSSCPREGPGNLGSFPPYSDEPPFPHTFSWSGACLATLRF
jgi:hypothetical protein